MVERESSIRPLPLKVAGAIGAFAAVLYLAVAVAQPEGLGPAVFWFLAMVAAALLAWLPTNSRDDVPRSLPQSSSSFSASSPHSSSPSPFWSP